MTDFFRHGFFTCLLAGVAVEAPTDKGVPVSSLIDLMSLSVVKLGEIELVLSF